MKVMTFNTQHCLNYRERVIDFEVMAKAILDCDADVVGLNEMRGAGEHPEYTDQVGELARLTGMPYYYFAPALTFAGKGPYGNGILSKIPFVRVRNVPIPDPAERPAGHHFETRCVLAAELENGYHIPEETAQQLRQIADQIALDGVIPWGDETESAVRK